MVGPETRYLCRALAEFTQADEIELLATADAQRTHREHVTQELRLANQPLPNFHSIP
jgi:hypothetical protein